VRMIIRRPSSAAKFSGKVVVEWLNVTNILNWMFSGTGPTITLFDKVGPTSA
jgi:Alpha/beta hydrolase domain